jgi:hypothetical protein
MKKQKAMLGRREVLRTLVAGATVVAAADPRVDQAGANASNYQDKYKARYQPNSADVQNFYRVNRYPPK